MALHTHPPTMRGSRNLCQTASQLLQRQATAGEDTTVDIYHLTSSYNQPQQSHSQHSQLCCTAKYSSREARVWYLGWPGDRSEAPRSCHMTYTRQRNSAMRRSALLCPATCHTLQHLLTRRPSVAAESCLRNLCAPTSKGT